MAAPILTGSHPKALKEGVKAWWGVGYAQHGEEWRDLFEVEGSSDNFEEDVQMKGFPLAPVKTEGKATTYYGQTQGYTSRYTHVAYSLGFICTYEEIRDNKYMKLAKSRAIAVGASMSRTKNTVGANVYNRLTNTSYTGGDGSALGVTTHSTETGNQQNILTNAADISETSLEDLCILIMKATDDIGNKIGLMPISLHVPPDLWFEANRILKSVLQNDTANNALNVLKSTNALPGGIKMNHYFTDTDAYFIRTNCPDSMKFYQRDSYDMKEDNDFDTDNLKYKSYDRYEPGWTDWRGLYSSPGA